MARRPLGSVSLAIVMGVGSIVLTSSMLVGWIVVLLQNRAITRHVASNTWLMVAGITTLSIILLVLVWFSIFLVREIREGRRQTTFIDSVTHELKSPLASIKLCLETLSREGLSEEQRTQLRDMMTADVDRLAVFIEDILVATRVANRPFYAREGHVLQDLDAHDLIDRCVQAIGRRYRVEPTAFRCDVEPGLTFTSDGTAVETILKNLLDNAVKYSGANVDIRVRAFRETRWVWFEVCDDGIGIPHKHIKRIFDRFYRVPGEAVRARRGTGLGLFVVSGLVRSLGGKLEAHSEGLDRGTCIRVALPIANNRRHAA